MGLFLVCINVFWSWIGAHGADEHPFLGTVDKQEESSKHQTSRCKKSQKGLADHQQRTAYIQGRKTRDHSREGERAFRKKNGKEKMRAQTECEDDQNKCNPSRPLRGRQSFKLLNQLAEKFWCSPPRLAYYGDCAKIWSIFWLCR
jgi:hypothetical protein